MHMVTMNNHAYKLLLRANAFAVSHQLPFFLSFIVWYTYEGLLWSIESAQNFDSQKIAHSWHKKCSIKQSPIHMVTMNNYAYA